MTPFTITSPRQLAWEIAVTEALAARMGSDLGLASAVIDAQGEKIDWLWKTARTVEEAAEEIDIASCVKAAS